MRDSSARVLLVVLGLLAAGCAGDAFDTDPEIGSGQRALGEPAPQLQVTPTNILFGLIPLGSSATQTFTVRNSGPFGSVLEVGPMQVSSLPGEFTIVQQGCTFPLQAGVSCVVSVRAAPTSTRGSSGAIGFMTNAGFGFVSMAAVGIASGIQVTPATIDFGLQLAGTTTVRPLTITSTGDQLLVVTGVQWTNATSNFDFQMGTCGGPLPRGATCTAQVRFFPSANGPHNASFQVLSNAFGPPPTVSLTGAGLVPARLAVAPAQLDFGDVLVGSSAAQDVTISNTGGTLMQVSDFGTGGDFGLAIGTCGSTPFQLGPGGSCTLTVRFTPTAAGPRANTLVIVAAGEASIPLSGTGVATADLQVTMAGPAEAKVKRDITYTITVTNAGPSPATDVVVSDALPDVSTFVSVLADDFTCTTPTPGTNGTVSCQLAALGAGETRTLTVIAHLEAGGKTTITNTAMVSSSTSDPEGGNNSASVETELKGKM